MPGGFSRLPVSTDKGSLWLLADADVFKNGKYQSTSYTIYYFALFTNSKSIVCVFALYKTDVAQRISESLGAQINPDLSWSSSLNTPSSLTPTYILSKNKNAHVCFNSFIFFIVVCWISSFCLDVAKKQEQSSAVETSEERIIVSTIINWKNDIVTLLLVVLIFNSPCFTVDHQYLGVGSDVLWHLSQVGQCV